MGLEPIRCCHQQILSLPRLPFRHAGIRSFTEQSVYYHIAIGFATKILKWNFRKIQFEKRDFLIALLGGQGYTDKKDVAIKYDRGRTVKIA